jgi:nickel transport system permease protein
VAGLVLRRLTLLVPLLLLVSLLVFVILRVGAGDPAVTYLRLSRIPPTEAALAEARQMLGLDRPLVVQYGDWLAGALRLDFGTSYVTHRPVLGDLLYYLPATLTLAGASLALTLGISLPLGILAALRRDHWVDHATRLFAFVGVSTPSFWLGFLLVYLFALRLGWLPPMGKGGVSHLILPAVTLALMSTAVNTRLIRASVLEQLHARAVLYARARGVPERWVIGRHVLTNAMIPIVTAVGMHAGELLGGAVVVESIFAWPGVGRYAVSAIFNRDYPVLQCFTLLMAAIFVVCNLLVDVLYACLDPRIRLASRTAP